MALADLVGRQNKHDRLGTAVAFMPDALRVDRYLPSDLFRAHYQNSFKAPTLDEALNSRHSARAAARSAWISWRADITKLRRSVCASVSSARGRCRNFRIHEILRYRNCLQAHVGKPGAIRDGFFHVRPSQVAQRGAMVPFQRLHLRGCYSALNALAAPIVLTNSELQGRQWR